jgi:chromosome segregation ATPase
MKNEESIISLDNIVYLRNNSDQESINLNFRSKLIGGLNEEDVKKFISVIENKYQQKVQEMNELVSAKNLLQAELAIYKATTLEEKRSMLESLEKAHNDLAVYVDECNNKDLALQSLSDKKNSEIAQLQNEIKQMAEKQRELEKLISVSNLESEQIMESAAGFEKENNLLKSKIADLEKDISSNNTQDSEINNIVREFEQQIELEKSRYEKQSLGLEKAHNDLAVYVDEITQLQNEIKQMAEKQRELEKLISVSKLEFEQIMESAAGFEKENNILKSKIADLEKDISSNNTQDAEINKIVRELEQQIEFEKSRYEKQSTDLEMYNQKIINLEKTIEVQRKISEKTEQELNLEKARASNFKVHGFKDEIVNIYQKLEQLTAEQVNLNNELQHQLEVEQLRANTAENSLEELIQWVSGLKDKLFNEQNMFETQVRQLAERHSQFRSEISDCFLNRVE